MGCLAFICGKFLFKGMLEVHVLKSQIQSQNANIPAGEVKATVRMPDGTYLFIGQVALP